MRGRARGDRGRKIESREEKAGERGKKKEKRNGERTN